MVEGFVVMKMPFYQILSNSPAGRIGSDIPGPTAGGFFF